MKRTPARCSNSAAAKCCELPAPAMPQFSAPGLALARAISSATLRTGTDGWTTSRHALRAIERDRGEVAHHVEGQVAVERGVGGVRAMEATTRVWPSGALRATCSVATLPAAPVRFSTTTGWPSPAVIPWATTRAVVSVLPPGAKPTTKRTGRSGLQAGPVGDLLRAGRGRGKAGARRRAAEGDRGAS